ncbi:MAG TPA: hypothetical protein VJS30_27515 [Paraburkholderia sp.]|nr:hypothetical protein [Paraburkholderia sp.]
MRAALCLCACARFAFQALAMPLHGLLPRRGGWRRIAKRAGGIHVLRHQVAIAKRVQGSGSRVRAQFMHLCIVLDAARFTRRFGREHQARDIARIELRDRRLAVEDEDCAFPTGHEPDRCQAHQYWFEHGRAVTDYEASTAQWQQRALLLCVDGVHTGDAIGRGVRQGRQIVPLLSCGCNIEPRAIEPRWETERVSGGARLIPFAVERAARGCIGRDGHEILQRDRRAVDSVRENDGEVLRATSEFDPDTARAISVAVRGECTACDEEFRMWLGESRVERHGAQYFGGELP